MQNERYIRQVNLKGFGSESQEKLKQASVLVVGAGGLGVPVLQYLNAMGVGEIGLIDNDVVSLSNLHRQVLYAESDVNSSKVVTAIGKLKAQNSETRFTPYESFLTKENAISIILNFDLVVDASDNFETRYLVNDACVLLNKTFIYGALHGFEGHISVFNYKGGPTYRCLFPIPPSANETPDCNEQGVLGVIPGIIGNMQALEAVKVITGIGRPLSGKLLIFDGLDQKYHKFNIIAVSENKNIRSLKDSYELNSDVVLSISVFDFSGLLESKDEIQIIDVRTENEYDSFHIEGSTHIPLDTLLSRGRALNFELPIYFICQSGRRSIEAILLLKAIQPKATLINITGGVNQLRGYASR